MHLIKSVLIESNVSESRDSYSRFGRRKTAVLFPKLTDQNISAPTNDSWNPSNQQETLYKPDLETLLPSLGTSPDVLRHEGCISYVEEGSSHLSHVKRKRPHGRIASWVTSREIQADEEDVSCGSKWSIQVLQSQSITNQSCSPLKTHVNKSPPMHPPLPTCRFTR